MRHTIKILAILSLVVIFHSCKVEFSPNAQWQEIPTVYCLLDQDDDTTYIRVQKCFLGEGDLYSYGSIYDSINYPQGEIEVKLVEWKAWRDSKGEMQINRDLTPRELPFTYTLLNNKDSGSFSSPSQPVFIRRTAGELDTNCVYELLVIKNNGDTIASATTALLYGSIRLTMPTIMSKFQFSGYKTKRCAIEFTPLKQGRRYQAKVRFYYRDFVLIPNGAAFDTIITPHYIDIEGSTVRSSMNSSLISINFEQSTFLGTISEQLKGSDINRNIIDTIDLYINACDENFSSYLYSNDASATTSQAPTLFSNINGGVGVFAARRTHLKFTLPTPANSDSQYKKDLKALNVGF